MKFYLVDVFAEKDLAGNQLAVCCCNKQMTTSDMQAIAREINFSETAFVVGGDRQPGYDVRIFTPAQELPFAGHPTLGTAAVIARHYLPEHSTPPSPITLNLGVGPVRVSTEETAQGKLYWLDGPPVTVQETVSIGDICTICRSAPEVVDTDFPVQRLCVGPTFTLVPYRTLQGLDAMQLDRDAYRERFGSAAMAEVYGICRQSRAAGHDLSVRLLFDASGVREDAATGSAAVCLGAWLLEHNYLQLKSFSIKVEQGGLIHRPSTLHLRGRTSGERSDIKVGGRVAFVAAGDWIASAGSRKRPHVNKPGAAC